MRVAGLHSLLTLLAPSSRARQQKQLNVGMHTWQLSFCRWPPRWPPENHLASSTMGHLIRVLINHLQVALQPRAAVLRTLHAGHVTVSIQPALGVAQAALIASTGLLLRASVSSYTVAPSSLLAVSLIQPEIATSADQVLSMDFRDMADQHKNTSSGGSHNLIVTLYRAS